MIPVNEFLIFALASLVLNITPGNDMLYVATRSASQGVRAGVVYAFFRRGDCIINELAAVIDLSAVI